MVGGKDTYNASSVHLNETKCHHSQYKHLSSGFFLFSNAYTGIAFVIQDGYTSELSLLASFQEMPVENFEYQNRTNLQPIWWYPLNVKQTKVVLGIGFPCSLW